jgi:hypothetical protein
MLIEPACMLCSIDPGTANLLVPVAQATIISAPFLLRDQIRRGVKVLRDHVGPARRPSGSAQEADADVRGRGIEGTRPPEA